MQNIGRFRNWIVERRFATAIAIFAVMFTVLPSPARADGLNLTARHPAPQVKKEGNRCLWKRGQNWQEFNGDCASAVSSYSIPGGRADMFKEAAGMVSLARKNGTCSVIRFGWGGYGWGQAQTEVGSDHWCWASGLWFGSYPPYTERGVTKVLEEGGTWVKNSDGCFMRRLWYNQGGPQESAWFRCYTWKKVFVGDFHP